MKKIFIGFFAAIGFLSVGLVGTLIYFMGKSSSNLDISPGTVLTYTLTELEEYNSPTGLLNDLLDQNLSLYDLVTTLDRAAQDPRVKGLVLRVDQASLGLAKIQELHGSLKRFKQAGKFVIVHTATFGEGNNATGQYYLASVANDIAMQPYGSVYLLGLGLDFFHGRKLLDTLKIIPRFYKRDEYKSTLDTYTEESMTPANREAMTALIQSLFNQIVRDIAIEREMTEADMGALINQAPIFGAKKALALGLIDHIYYYDQCLAYALVKAGEGSHFLPLEVYGDFMNKTCSTYPDSIAVIHGVGVITSFSKPSLALQGQANFSAEEFEKNIDQILIRKDIKAAILRLNSPGGSATASESVWRHLQRLKEKNIPVVVSIGDYGTSGGYWVASGANTVVAQPASLVGSIGVVGGKPVFQEIWKALGIQVDSISFGAKALMNNLHHDFSLDEWQSHQRVIDYIYNTFLIKVAKGRKMDVDHVHAIAKGRAWTGEDAQRLGLIDAVGDLAKAVSLAKELANISSDEPVNLITFPQAFTWWEKIQNFMKGDRINTTMVQKVFSFCHKTIMYIITLGEGVQSRLDIEVRS